MTRSVGARTDAAASAAVPPDGELALQALDEVAPWNPVLRAGDFTQRWQKTYFDPEGRTLRVTGTGADSRVRFDSAEESDGDASWSCAEAFVELAHEGDRTAAGADLLSSAYYDGECTLTARRLPDAWRDRVVDLTWHMKRCQWAGLDIAPPSEAHADATPDDVPVIALAARQTGGSDAAAAQDQSVVAVPSGVPTAHPGSTRQLTTEEEDLLARARRRFRLYDRDALDELRKPEPLIAGVLPRVGIAALVGSRGLGKSLLVLGMSDGVAGRQDLWCGLAVATHGPVMQVSLEGFAGVPERVRALERHHGRRMDGVTWISQPVDLKRESDARQLGLLAADQGVRLLVVDSARAAGAGAEDTADMSKFVKGLELAQHLTGGLVLVLHNTGWDPTRERGSTLLPDACDTVLLLSGGEGGPILTHRKQRDGEPLDPGLRFRFNPVAGTTSGVLLPVATAGDRALHERLLQLVVAEPGKSTKDLADAAGVARTMVSSALNELQRAGHLANKGKGNRARWMISGSTARGT